jgi:hypothetical protein
MTIDTDILAALVSKKHACLAQLHALAERQLSLIADGKLGDLLRVLAAKQQLLADMQEIERKLAPFRQQEPADRRWRNPADRDRCAEQLNRCESLLADILRREKQGELELKQRRDEAAVQLRGAHSARHARQAYTSPYDAQRGGLDLTSEF